MTSKSFRQKCFVKHTCIWNINIVPVSLNNKTFRRLALLPSAGSGKGADSAQNVPIIT